MLTILSKNKFLFFFAIALLFLLRLWHITHFHHLYPDKCRQLHAAYHIIEGKGNIHCEADTNDITKNVYWTEYAWPVGYALTLAKMQAMGGLDMAQADLFFDIFATLLLIVSILLLLQIIEYERKHQMLLLLFLAISFTPFHFLSSTCLISLALYVLAIDALLCQEKKGFSLEITALLIGILLYLTIFFRYAYYPLMLLFPFYIGLKMWQENSGNSQSFWNNMTRFLKNKALYFIKIQVFYLLPILILQQITLFYYPGEATGSTKSYAFLFQPTIYWGNLWKTDGFLIQSLFYISPIQMFLEKTKEAELVSIIIAKIALLLTLIALYYYGKNLKSIWQTNLVQKPVYVVGFITFLLNVGMLFVMALFIAPMEAGIFHNYTYIQETRYFAPTFIFLLLFVCTQIEKNAFFRYLIYATFLYAIIFTTYVFSQIEILQKKDFIGTYQYYYDNLAENRVILKQEKAAKPYERWICTTLDDDSEKLFISIGIIPFEGNIVYYLQNHTIPEGVKLLLSQKEIENYPPNLLKDKQLDTICKKRFLLVGDKP